MQTLFFDNSDYVVELLNIEFAKLRQSGLEGSLRHAERGIDLGKRVTLKFEENKRTDGIELTPIPKDAWSWEEIREIQIRINERAYERVGERGWFGTRYNADAKVDIKIVQGYTE